MPAQNKTTLNDQLHWYKDAVIYELHIKAFKDGNCDGVGDFEGLLEKLDYLQNLGVTAIWLLPFYPSPLRDDGYDIADYYSINPAYGNIKQFKKFLKEAHDRGLKVITELVINHTSDQHPWFQRARRAPKDSPYRDYYVWTDNPNQYKDARIIFQDFEASNWTWDDVAQQYYWHRFFHHQPDLNYDNPEVQQEVFKIIDYWCEMGVDGFRLDAVPYLFERDGTNCENLPETHVFLKSLRKHVDANYPGTLLLAEANMWPEDSVAYFGNGDECQMNYHFPVMPRMFMALQMEDYYPITDIFDQTPDIPETCQWAIFLRNHDELTLEMVTDEERDYMYRVYAKDPKAKINLGIRHRLAPLMDNNLKKIQLLNSMLFSLKGTPVIYYGDEIGMGDNFYLGDRDGVRTPMQWAADRNAGFSDANPQKLYLPVILDPQYNYESVNVEHQNGNTSSLLWWMKRVINTRKKHKAFSRGDMKFVNTDNPKVLAFTRTYEEETILVIVNLSRYAQPAELDLSAYAGYQLTEVFSKNVFPSVKEGHPYLFTLGQYDFQWFNLEQVHTATDKRLMPHLSSIKALEDLVHKAKEEFESTALPEYLQKMRWFGGKARLIENITITDHFTIQLTNDPVLLLLIDVIYNSGQPETYQLPVAFENNNEHKIKETAPAAIISYIKLDGADGLLYDALHNAELQQLFIQKMAHNSTLTMNASEIHFSGNKSVKAYVKENDKIKPKVLSVEQSNTSIIYDKAFFLKLYRKVDRSINPDLEITRFLTEVAKFPHIPAFTGAIEWRSPNGSMVLGMMQEMVENNTDGWTFMLDKLGSFCEKILASVKTREEAPTKKGHLFDPLSYDNLSDELKELLDASVAERVRQLGIRTAEMHIALASSGDLKAFAPEPFSLHYQRSLYSSFLTLIRRTFQGVAKKAKTAEGDVAAELSEVYAMKEDILRKLKRIYSKKLDVVKTRIHGDYHLGQTLFTGKDIIILDFEGEPAHSYSERRLKRSPLRDVAGMIRSFHYAAYGSLFLNTNMHRKDIEMLIPFVEQWYHYMSGIYFKAYLKTAKDCAFLPASQDDLELMINTYLLEKAVYELNYELNNRPEWVIIPLRGIKAVMEKM